MIEIIARGISYLVYGFACLWIGYGMGRKSEKEKQEIDECTRALARQVEANAIWERQQRENNAWKAARQKEMMDRQDIMYGRKPRRKREIKIVN